MLRLLLKRSALLLFIIGCAFILPAQENLPQDYLPASFHKGRREAARALMPEHSVMVVFAAPTRTFSNDVSYFYHQNPDLYYFTGYKEPNSVLFIFKDIQTGANGDKFNELFFVQKKNPLAEQWTGRRLGTEGVTKNLGIKSVYNGDDFETFPLDFSKFNSVIFGSLPEGVADDVNDKADLYDLLSTFKQKINLPADYANSLFRDLSFFASRASVANIDRMVSNFKIKMASTEDYRNNDIVKAIVQIKNAEDIEKVQQLINDAKINTLVFEQYNRITKGN